MHGLLHWVTTQAYLILFVAVFCDQAAISFPSQPVLMGMGALIAAGTHSLLLALPLAIGAALLADCSWYLAGRFWGHRATHVLSRVRPSLGAGTAKVQVWVARRKLRALLGSKFAPGPSFVAPLLAGAGRLSLRSFLLADALVCFTWTIAFIAAGYFGAHPFLPLNGR